LPVTSIVPVILAGGGRPQIMSYTPTTPHFKPKAPFGRVFRRGEAVDKARPRP